MGKSGKISKTNSHKSEKDHLQSKSGSGGVVKAKDKRKKSNIKKVMDKVGKDITSADAKFVELQSKLIAEKENEKTKCDENKPIKANKVFNEPSISQEKRLEETSQILSYL